MSVREVGSYIGYNRVTSTSQDSASGIWSLAAAERRMRAAAWPMPQVPLTISGLQLWLDASDASTLYDATTGGSLVAADGTVARWEDKSGNARHATEASNKPTRKVAAQNGLDVVRGNGTSSRLACAAFSSSLVRSVFVVAVSQETPQVDTYAMLLGQADSALTGDGDDCWFFGATADGTGSQWDRVRAWISDGSAGISAFVDTAFVTNEAALYSYINNGTGVFRKGNESATFPSAGQHQTRTKQLGLFCAHPFGTSPNTINFWDGDIAEIIIYDSALSDTDREAVENYLMTKWAIT